MENKATDGGEQKVRVIDMGKKRVPVYRVRHPNEPIQQSLQSKILAAQTIDELDLLMKDFQRFYGGASDKTKRRIVDAERLRRRQLLDEFEARQREKA